MSGIESNYGDNKDSAFNEGIHSQNNALAVMKTIIGECFCGPIGRSDPDAPTSHFIELHGIEFIGLGAVTDELSAKERVYDTLEQLTERTERLISIGRFVDDENATSRKRVESIPLDIWNQTRSHDRTISRQLRRTIEMIKASQKFQASLVVVHLGKF